MDAGSKAGFARKYGYSKSAVTKFDKAKKLVYLPNGEIDFVASRNLIDATSDPARIDVRQRHAKNRGEVDINSSNIHESFQKARAVKEKYAAMMAKLEFEKEEGLLVEKDDIEKIIFERGRQFRDGLMILSRRIAPVIIGCDSAQEAESILNIEFRNILDEFSKLPVVE